MPTLRALLPCIFVVSAGYLFQVDATTDYVTIPVSVPNGTVQHGNPRLVCPPARWYDIAIFYLVNYVSHAATVKTVPGEKTLSKMFNVIAALLFPYSGVIRGVEAMARHGTTYSDHLKRAVRSGALCIVIRTESWAPKTARTIQGVRINRELVARLIRSQKRKDHEEHAQGRGPWMNGRQSSSEPTYVELSEISGSVPSNAHYQDNLATYDVSYPQKLQGVPWKDAFWSRKIHGLQWLPEGYGIAVLPSNVVVHSMDKTFNEDVFLNSSQNIPKGLIAVVQSIFAGVTLYRTRGDQLDQYGYAAFGLTVLPYLIMSIINLLGNIATPDYPALYLVKSPELEEAESGSNGGVFNAVVGEVALADADTRAGPSGIFEVNTDNDLVFRGKNLFVDPFAEPSISRDANSSKTIEFQVVHDGSCSAVITVPPYTEFKTDGIRFWNEKNVEHWSNAVAIILGAIPYGVISGLTRFHTGHSTRAQQVLTQFWLAVGIFIGSVIPVLRSDRATLQYSQAYFEYEYRQYVSRWRDWAFVLMAALFGLPGDNLPTRVFAKLYGRMKQWYASWGLTFVLFGGFLLYAAPAIGGFVVVGQILNEYGSCTRF